MCLCPLWCAVLRRLCAPHAGTAVNGPVQRQITRTGPGGTPSCFKGESNRHGGQEPEIGRSRGRGPASHCKRCGCSVQRERPAVVAMGLCRPHAASHPDRADQKVEPRRAERMDQGGMSPPDRVGGGQEESMKVRRRSVPAALGGKPSSRFGDRPMTASDPRVSEEAGSSVGTSGTQALVSGCALRGDAEGTV